MCAADSKVRRHSGSLIRIKETTDKHDSNPCAEAERTRVEAAKAELGPLFAEQQAAVRQICNDMLDHVLAEIKDINRNCPSTAPKVTILGCSELQQKQSWCGYGPSKRSVVLHVGWQESWSSFGFSVAHLTSRSLGGEAGALYRSVLDS